MSPEEQGVYERLLVAIGATSDVENIFVRRRAAMAAVPEVLAMLREHAHELAEKIRQDPMCTKPYHRDYFADLIDPEVTSGD